MANLEPKLLYIGNEDDGVIYTVSSNTGSYAIVRNINLCNTSNTDTTLSMHLITTGSAASNNKIISNIKVPANDVVVSDATYVMNASHVLHVTQPTSNVTIAVSGVEFITGS